MNVDTYRKLVIRHLRGAHMRQFERLFHLDENTRVLDVGGTRFNWDLIATKPRITMVNVEGETGRFGNIEMRYGDATDLSFADGSFDLVYSNSVIEHVGDWPKIQAYADNVPRLAPCYYVRTPNKWFPVEPHCIGLIPYWIPFRIRRRLYRWLSINGWRNRPNQDAIDRHLSSIRLLTEGDVRRLFPDAILLKAPTWLFPFLAKSFVLLRGADLGSEGRTARLTAASARRPTPRSVVPSHGIDS